MFLELSKALSFLLSLLSLYPVLMSAFFVPGTRWPERLFLALDKAGLSACVCFASGLIFTWPAARNAEAGRSLLSTLPVRVFFSGLGGMALMFGA